MSTLKTSEAAALLNVSTHTLRAWERRFGYPKPQRTTGGHRIYQYTQIAELRDALAEGMAVSSAISRVRAGSRGDQASLVASLEGLEFDRADAAIQSALAMLRLEQCLEEVLLPALSELAVRHGEDSARWALVWGWAREWMSRAHLFAASAEGGTTVLIGDASGRPFSADQPWTVALELLLAAAGVNTIMLPIELRGEVGEVASASRPDLIVIAGSGADDDLVARWTYAVRASAGPVRLAVFRRAAGTCRRLPAGPSAAVREALALLSARGRASRVHEERVSSLVTAPRLHAAGT